MSRLRLAVVVLALGLARTAPAHSPTPASMLAALNAPEARAAQGVQRAEQDAKNPPVLVVRVEPPGSSSAVPNACCRPASGATTGGAPSRKAWSPCSTRAPTCR
jgi:hypothetical protein